MRTPMKVLSEIPSTTMDIRTYSDMSITSG